MAALLVGLSVMSVMMAAALPVWSQATRREREEELVWRGEQYKRAIMLFQRKFANTFPPNIDVLVDQKFLRKKYKDPITGEDFQIIPVGGAVPGQGGAGLPTPGARPGTGGTPGRGSSNTPGTGGFGATGQQQSGFGQQPGGFGQQQGGFGQQPGGFGQQPGGFGQQQSGFGQQAGGGLGGQQPGGLGQQPGGFGQQPGGVGSVGGGTPGYSAGHGHPGSDVQEQGHLDPTLQRDGQVQPVGLRLPRRVDTSRIRRATVREARSRRNQQPTGPGRVWATWRYRRSRGIWTARWRRRPAARPVQPGGFGQPGPPGSGFGQPGQPGAQPKFPPVPGGFGPPGGQPAAPSPFRPPGAVPFGQPSPPRE